MTESSFKSRLGLSTLVPFPARAETQYVHSREGRSRHRARRTRNHVRHRLAYETAMN